MQNYKQEGETLTLTAPYARSAGQGALVGAIFGVACNDVLNGAAGEFQTEGVFTLTKVGSQAWAVGDKIYWDNGNKRCTTVATDGMLIGVATAVAGSGAGVVTGDVRLNGSAPSMAEGPQAAVVVLTDSTGLSASHDDAIASGVLTGTLTGTVNGSLADIAAAAGNCQGGSTPTATQVDTAIATGVAPIVSGTNEQHAEIQAKLTVLTQNDSDLAQKIIELRAALVAAGIIAA